MILCGINDWKLLFHSEALGRGDVRTPGVFRDDLSALVAEVRAHVGPDCAILLPALPVSLIDFPWPLSLAVRGICDAWDEQKRTNLAATEDRIHYLDACTTASRATSSPAPRCRRARRS